MHEYKTFVKCNRQIHSCDLLYLVTTNYLIKKSSTYLIADICDYIKKTNISIKSIFVKGGGGSKIVVVDTYTGYTKTLSLIKNLFTSAIYKIDA